MGLGARMRLIIYLQPWSESMALAPSIYGFLPFPPRPKFFEFIQNRKRNLWIWKKNPILELVSMFHPIWCLVAQESKLRRKFLGGSDISGNFTGYIR
jgi:hypothetical protein